MTDTEKCGVCSGVLGTGAWSTYSPYPRHADMGICVKNIRADERERIAQAIEAEHQPLDEWCCFNDTIHSRLILDARIARQGGSDG